MIGRSVPEWIGKTQDSKVPPHVRLRIFDRYQGRDYITGRKIMPGDVWHLDHVKALCNGGENREFNLAPILADKHKEKTAADRSEKSKVDRMREKHLGIYPKPARRLQSRNTLQRRATS